MSITTVAVLNNDIAVKGAVSKAFSIVKYKLKGWRRQCQFFAPPNIKQTDTVQTLLDEAVSLVDCDIKQNLSRFRDGEDVSQFGLAVRR